MVGIASALLVVAAPVTALSHLRPAKLSLQGSPGPNFGVDRRACVPAVCASFSPMEMVPGEGVEPTRLAATDFESVASANSAIRATRSRKARRAAALVNLKFRESDDQSILPPIRHIFSVFFFDLQVETQLSSTQRPSEA